MNRTAMAFLCILPLVLITSACWSSYRGDGQFTDHGPFWGTGRYELDLGSVDLTRRGDYHYTITNLPKERFAVGLAFGQAGSNADPQTLPSNATVRLQLRSSTGSLIEHEKPLAEWVHSTGGIAYSSFFYCKGAADTWAEEAGTSWGCVFKPLSRQQYQLTLEVLQPDSKSRPATLRMQGGPRDFLP
jgi:hypothetical protein